MEPLIIILIVSLIILTLWNILTLRSYKKKISNEAQLNDGKYFELKSKIEYMIATFLVVATVIGILGYTNLDNVKRELKADFQKKVDSLYTSIKEAEVRISKIDTTLKNFSSISVNLYSNISNLENRIAHGNSSINSLNDKIKNINEKNILKRNFYTVDYQINLKNVQDLSDMKCFFKDMITNFGDKLPEFNKPPIILITPTNGIDLTVREVTKGYVQLAEGTTWVENPMNITLTLVIIENN